jgi:hypothetical protein
MENIWIDVNGNKIPVQNLDDSYLVNAFTQLCERDYALFKKLQPLLDKSNRYADLKEMLLIEAKKRNLAVVYPDQVNPNPSPKAKEYFDSERKRESSIIADFTNAEKAVLAPSHVE